MNNKIIDLIKEKYGNYKLCYVESSSYMDYEYPITLYFTSLNDVTKQWGDDWNDKPYEHNAGEPYTEMTIDEKKVKADMMKVLLRSYHIMTPRTNYINSAYSVEEINNKKVPWLQLVEYGGRDMYNVKEKVEAGETLIQVLDKIKNFDDYSDIEIFISLK